MIEIDIREFQTDLTRLMDHVSQGQTIVVTRDGEPIAELRPAVAGRKTPRPLGLGRGLGEVRPSFFDPLPEDVLGSFYGAEP